MFSLYLLYTASGTNIIVLQNVIVIPHKIMILLGDCQME